jgi:hypothetical protein
MARLKQLVIDARHPAALARFWVEVLDGFAIRPYDDAEVARLAALGLTPETDPVVILDGPGLEVCFQQVDVEPVRKKPVHVDLDSADRAGEVTRLAALGAEVVEVFDAHTWLRDPEGNDFCVTD